MSEHKPECPETKQCVYDENNQCWVLHEPCICDRLRACESRIRSGYADTYTEGIAAGLDAAREAIDSMVIETAGNSAATVNQALAAIDALKLKEKK